MKEKPMTNIELFRLINKQLQDAGILDKADLEYALPASEEYSIRNYEWDLIGTIRFGTNEGIYLELKCVGDTGNGNLVTEIPVGTYKTLDTAKSAYEAMAIIMTEFVYAAAQYVDSHMDDFTWKGYSIIKVRFDHEINCMDCPTLERAVERATEMVEKSPAITSIVIRENATRKRRTYTVTPERRLVQIN